MPYIDAAKRERFDPLIDRLAEEIAATAGSDEHEAAFAGYLNYACTRLALKVVRLRFHRIRYWLIALLSGTFRNVADEFYRRLAAPYEDKQIKKNGDVDEYEALLAADVDQAK
ncbi:MAG: hypothetical protein WCT10_00680 [Patescibacteria group bacterium]|jgi:hypothetical protein